MRAAAGIPVCRLGDTQWVPIRALGPVAMTSHRAERFGTLENMPVEIAKP